ncbi:MAG: hypothetical protein KatS3mg076_2539 [Candidatus Binatia bacterium]|nr:MAG: hypothetical protein KatS3mg076_2539 [Candidatus Binatia bacterium]
MAAASRKGLFLAAFLAVASAAGAQPFLFVTWEQSGQVVVIDTASDPNVLVGAFAAGRSPRHLAFAPNGEFGYVLADGRRDGGRFRHGGAVGRDLRGPRGPGWYRGRGSEPRSSLRDPPVFR